MPKKKNRLPKNAKRVFKGVIYEVWQWPQKMYDGSTETFERLKRPDTMQIIPVVGDKILILKQKQPDSPKTFYSFAGGRREKGETALNGAKRELLEETGYVSRNWKLWKTRNPFVHMVWTVHSYIARDCVFWQPPQLDAGEKIESQLISFDELLSLAEDLNYYEKELTDYLQIVRADKKEYNKFHKLLFKK